MAGALLHSPSTTCIAETSSLSTSRFFSAPSPSCVVIHQQRIPSSRAGRRIPKRLSNAVKIISSAATQGVASVVDQSNKQQGVVDELWTWWLAQTGTASGGAVVFRPSHFEKEGLGLVVQRDVRKGEELMQVSKGSWICLETVKQSPIGTFVEGQRPWVKLALFLIGERADPNSKWLPYLRSLPESLDSTLFWSEEELMELQGTQLLGSTLSFREYVEAEFNLVKNEVMEPNANVFDATTFTFEAFLWGFGILRSRTFAPLTGDDLALVPMTDLVNHGGIPDTDTPSWELRKGTGFFGSKDALVVRAAKNFQPEEQIIMDYGASKGNGQLALDYGFVEKRTGSSVVRQSTLRDTFSLTLELPEEDRFYDDKLDVAELNGLGASVSFDLVAGQGPPEELLAYLRLMVIEGPDAFLLEALFRNSVWGHILLPVSRENEEAVCTSILDGCRAALAAYSTTIDEDVMLLEAGIDSPRLEIAVVVRLGEKRVLEELQAWLEAHSARVENLEFYAERRLKDLGLLDDKGFMTPWIFGQ